MGEIRSKIQYDNFVGPLPKEAYDALTNEFDLSHHGRIVELAARALYGQKKAQANANELQGRIAETAVDGLTKLYRRDVIYHQLQDMICGLEMKRRVSDTAEDIAVIVFDVENFKEINDHSWAEGNAQLKAVGNSLLSTARTSKGDIPGRIGGDEFVLILPYKKTDTKPKELLDSIEDRIRNIMPQKFPNQPPLRWHHAFYQPGDDAETLINRAYPKGDNKQLARSHSQIDTEYKQVREQSMAATLPNELTLLKEA
jgi:diguanylate cyclase (GGDEF)-like protein